MQTYQCVSFVCMKADVEVKGEGVEGKRTANWLDSSGTWDDGIVGLWDCGTVGLWECGNA